MRVEDVGEFHAHVQRDGVREAQERRSDSRRQNKFGSVRNGFGDDRFYFRTHQEHMGLLGRVR